MGKKGSRKKTQWRTLSIGAPPGEEDDEEKLCNGYAKGQERSTGTPHGFERGGSQGPFKPRRSSTRSSGTSGNGGATVNGGPRLRREDASTDSSAQPKIMFNEDEYTRITTPRQDMLFKKGYLSRKKPWASNASTSATPSTTESQSASHSTADGSETTEDQQLLDRDSRTGEYPSPAPEALGAQLSYGTFYDHSSGYYYEYPIMLVGPAPVPAAQVEPGVLAAMPCTSLPLRPIEWVNPAFVPKLSGQSYCLMDYQTGQSTECPALADEQGCTILSAETGNNSWNESGTGSASCSGSVAEETEEQAEELNPEEVQVAEENCVYNAPYVEPPIMQQPMHVPHVVSAGIPQPYMYPGHYMFGPSLVNINGVTIQSGPMIRSNDVAAAEVFAKRRKKKKRRKQRRPALGNTEDEEEEEEGEYSSECENGLTSSRLVWSADSTSGTTATTGNRPLNPEVQEFQLRPVVQSCALDTVVAIGTSEDVSIEEEMEETLTANHASDQNPCPTPSFLGNGEAVLEGNPSDSSSSTKTTDLELAVVRDNLPVWTASDAVPLKPLNEEDLPNENERLSDCLAEKEPVDPMKETSVSDTTGISEGSREIYSCKETDVSALSEERNESSRSNGTAEEPVALGEPAKPDVLSNGKSSPPFPREFPETLCSKSSTSKTDNPVNKSYDENLQRLSQNSSLDGSRASSLAPPRRKYSNKASKFVREATPGPDLAEFVDPEDSQVGKDSRQLSGTIHTNGNIPNGSANRGENEMIYRPAQVKAELCEHRTSKGTENIVGSGFEGPTLVPSYPITSAITEWLRKANSPEIFKVYSESSESETDYEYGEGKEEEEEEEDDDDDDEEEEKGEEAASKEMKEIKDRKEGWDERLAEKLSKEPPKNLQSNPMPALSANSGADNAKLSLTAGCSEFVRVKDERAERLGGSTTRADARRTRNLERARKNTAKAGTERPREISSANDDKVASDAHVPNSGKDEPEGTRDKFEELVKESNNVSTSKDLCEFTEIDSVVGMRVASSSRMGSTRASVRRSRRRSRNKSRRRGPVENIDVKMRLVADDENDEGIVEDTVCVRTFEKGEIIVSRDGKRLPVSVYESVSGVNLVTQVTNGLYEIEIGKEQVEEREGDDDDDDEEVEEEEEGLDWSGGNRMEEDEHDSMIASLESIEEPDVLECWEAETIEPVITPKRILQSQGISCRGEATEDDALEVDASNLALVQKYYRLARETTPSIERDSSDTKTSIESFRSRSVPNNPEEMLNGFCYVATPVSAAQKEEKERAMAASTSSIPIEEAFEVYESCYTGRNLYFPDSKLSQARRLYGQDGEGPVPCKTVCCNIQ